jgi:hypothetical protein
MTPSGIEPATFRLVAQCLVRGIRSFTTHSLLHTSIFYTFLPNNSVYVLLILVQFVVVIDLLVNLCRYAIQYYIEFS